MFQIQNQSLGNLVGVVRTGVADCLDANFYFRFHQLLFDRLNFMLLYSHKIGLVQKINLFRYRTI